MFSSLLDYLCSRPFPEAPRWRWRLRALLWAAAFGVLAFAVGWALSGDFAVPGENTTALAALSGSPVVMDFIGPRNVLGASHPLLWSLVGLFGAAPTMGALNLLGAAVMGVIVALTWLLVRFWCLDGGGEETSTLRLARRAWFASGAVCLAFLFSLPGLYGATTLTFNAWGFMLLLLCAVLQNVYAMSGGRRRLMVLASVVLGACAVETPWVLALVPFFFLRAVVAEWRLWDHSARNLTFWFVGFVAGAAAVLSLATWRVTGGFSPFAVWGVEREVLEHVFLPTVMGWVAGPWLLNVAGAVALPLVAWGVARALLANTRSLGLLIGGVVVTGCAFGLQWGLIPLSPWVNWLAMGGQPLAVGWMGALACGMLAAGWGVQLLARASTMHQDPDTRRELPIVRAGRIVGGVCLAATVAALAVTCGVQTHRFLKLDRAMATRFAEETVGPLQEQGRTYLLGSRTGWIDPHLALVARERGYPLTLFVTALAGKLETDERPPESESEKALDRALRASTYLTRLHTQLWEDPALGDVDRFRLTHLLDYDFYVFVEDFFKAQPNARQIAAAYDLADVWSVLDTRLSVAADAADGAQRAIPDLTYYLPTPARRLATDAEAEAKIAAQQTLQARWADTLAEPELPWWDLNRGTQAAIRRHLGLMANNLGVWLNDQGALAAERAADAARDGKEAEAKALADQSARRLAQAADSYYYAFKTDPGNLSAKLNVFYLCVEQGLLPERRDEISRDFEALVRNLQETGRRYDFGAVGYLYGYIRNYAAFVQRGWGWAATAAPEAILSYLGGRRAALGDAALSNVNIATAAVYELHGQIESSESLYRAVLEADPDNFEALRGLARLALQRGQVREAGAFLARAEAVIDRYEAGFDAFKAAFREALSRADARLIVNDDAGAIEALKGDTDLPKEDYRRILEQGEAQGAVFRAEAHRGLARIALREGDRPEAARQLVRAQQAIADAAPPLTPLVFDQAAYLMAKGDLEGAARAVSAYIKANPDALDGWAMLGMIEVERGDRARAANEEADAQERYRAASGHILDNITRLAHKNGQDAYFAHIIRGRLAQSEARKAEAGALSASGIPPAARERWKEARDQYRRAYALRPRIRSRLLESILHIDRRLGDKSAAEADAFAILREEPANPFANFVIGTQRMEDAHFDEARTYFARSYDARGLASGLELINNYAEALARSADPADRARAEALAEDAALRQAPGNYVLRATYALTLALNGKPEQAKETLAQAREIAETRRVPVDPRIGFVDAWIAVGQGKNVEAKRCLDTLRAAIGADLTPRDRHDLAELQKAIR